MTNATEYVTIERRYRGPPDSANGGFACGLLGKRVNSEAMVRLKVRPPLERALSIVAEEPGRVAMMDPSWFGLLEFEPGATGAPLGELTARVVRRPAVDEPCVVIGWSRGRDGRKLYGGAALYTGGGTLLGSSRATWIEPRSF